MAQPTTRTEFKDWCLRKLGMPVIEINVDQDQIEDRIDEALSYYWDYHFDGTEKTFLSHEVTADDKTNRYITIPENIIGAVNLFPINTSVMSTSGMFSVQYQFLQNNLHEIGNGSLTDFYMKMSHLQFMEDLLVGAQPIRYNRHMNRLHIDTDWDVLNVGQFIVVECYTIVDPQTYTDVWKDRWLQNYAAAKIKHQWGSNLTKFVGMTLPGNVQFNGEQIYRDADEEIKKLEEEMIRSYSLPVSDMIG